MSRALAEAGMEFSRLLHLFQSLTCIFCNVVLGALGNVTMEQFCVTLCLVVKKSKEEEILKK